MVAGPSILPTTTWPRQNCRRAPGARVGSSESPSRGSGTVLHPFTVYATPERARREAPWAPVAGGTRFRSATAYLKAGELPEQTEHSARASDRTLLVRRVPMASTLW